MGEADLQRALERATDTRAVIVRPGALDEIIPALRRHFPESAALVIADENTMAAAGQRVAQALRAAGRLAGEPLVFAGSPRLHPDAGHVQAIESYLRLQPASPVAVGSGVINDLVKVAADRLQRPYLSVATAASMDGYTAFAAAITHDGIKRIDPCAAPRAVIADVDVLAAAPPEMAAAGYGDLLGKVVAGADWLIADALGIEAIEPTAWSHAQDGLRAWVGDPAALRRGDPGAFALLIEGLLMAGLAMQAARSSRPASGSEHLFSHLWEMEGLPRARVFPSHGFQVGLGTLASAALAERLLLADLGHLDPVALSRSWPAWETAARSIQRDFADPRLVNSAMEETRSKHLASDGLRNRLERIRSVWPELRARLQAQLMPARDLRAMLNLAGCPTTPQAMGLTPERLRRDYARARHIRARYTLLDLAVETGTFEASADSLFEPGGFWAQAGA